MLWKMIQRSFAGGRLDRELMGRQDLAAYFKGASEIENFVVRRQGGVAKRRGTNLTASLGDLSTGARLLPLVYSREEGYYILLHGGKAYLLSKDGLRNTTAVAEGATLWAATRPSDDSGIHAVTTGLADGILDEIDFMQSGDTVFVTHQSVAPFKLVFSRTALTLTKEAISFTSTDTTAEAPVITGVTPYYYGPSYTAGRGTESTAASVAFCVTFTPTGESPSPASKARLEDYVQGADPSSNYWVSATISAKIKTSAASGTFTFYKSVCYANISGRVWGYTADCFYRWEELGSTDVIASGGYATGSYTHSSAAEWKGEEKTFYNPFVCDSGNVDITAVQMDPTSWKNPYSATGGSSQTTSNNRVVQYCAARVDSDGVEHVQGPATSVVYPLPWPSGGKVTLTVKQSASITDKPKKFRLYKKESGTYGLVGEIDDITLVDNRYTGTFVDDYITPDLTSSTMERSEHFNAAGDYPATIALYQQRLVLGSTANDPAKFWMSVTGDLYNFDTHESLREDDAISATLSASEMPEINHVVMSRDLIMLASGGEWEVAPVSGNALSYKTISAKLQSAIGSARWVKPVTIGDEIVFVDGAGETLLATRYSYASDGYESKDLTILAKGLFADNGIVRMCYRRSPDSEIVCVLGDGTVAALAYMKEHDVCAWSRHVLGGGYLAKDCASSKALSHGSTEVMMLVSNAAGTAWEAWTLRDDIPAGASPQVADFACLDRCVTRTETASWTVPTGLTAVDTATATVYAAGATAPAGTFLAGYAIESRLVTVHPEPQGSETIQMEIKNATEVEARVIDASTFSIGPKGSAHLREIVLAPTATAGVLALCDADVKLPVCGSNNRDGRMEIVHTAPFTFNLTTLNTTYQVEQSNLNGGGNG